LRYRSKKYASYLARSHAELVPQELTYGRYFLRGAAHRALPTEGTGELHALDLDMATWFTPTAWKLFSRLTKTGIVDALKEAKANPAAPAWLRAKKKDVASIAEREVAGTGWLPAPLRRAA
jgi:hypothetical protein